MKQTVVDLLTNNAAHTDVFKSRFDDVQNSQHPDVVTVCCSDSRVLQDHMWGNDEPGHIFTCGNIGNRVIQQTADGPVISGDLLYPVAHTGTETIVVVGHTGCGAVTATFQDITVGLDEPAGIQHCIETLKPQLESGVEKVPDDLSEADTINHLVEYNVDRQIELLRESEEIPTEVTIVGVVYDFQDVYSGTRGETHVINVDGERDVESLRDDHPEIATRIERRWEY